MFARFFKPDVGDKRKPISDEAAFIKDLLGHIGNAYPVSMELFAASENIPSQLQQSDPNYFASSPEIIKFKNKFLDRVKEIAERLPLDDSENFLKNLQAEMYGVREDILGHDKSQIDFVERLQQRADILEELVERADAGENIQADLVENLDAWGFGVDNPVRKRMNEHLSDASEIQIIKAYLSAFDIDFVQKIIDDNFNLHDCELLLQHIVACKIDNPGLVMKALLEAAVIQRPASATLLNYQDISVLMNEKLFAHDKAGFKKILVQATPEQQVEAIFLSRLTGENLENIGFNAFIHGAADMRESIASQQTTPRP